MASRTVDIVRITHRELENLAENMSRNTGATHHRDDAADRKRADQSVSRQRKEKRPDMAIYRPGMSRLSRRTSPATPSDQSEESSSGTEISPPKSVKSPSLKSLVVERSGGFKQVNKGDAHSPSSKPPVNQQSSNASSSSREANKSNINRPSQQKISGEGGKRGDVSHREDFEAETLSVPAQSRRQVHGNKDAVRQTSTQDASWTEQREAKSRRGGEQPNKEARGNAHKDQLKVKIGGDVKEPSQISPTTVELISTWKGDRSDARVVKKSHQQGVFETTPKEESVSISKGKAPLRTEDNKPELSALYSPKPQRHQTHTSRTQRKEEERGNVQKEVSRTGSGDELAEQVHQKKEETNQSVLSPAENAADWDWVKELMNEKPPSEPKFYHGKTTADDCSAVKDVHSSETSKAQSSRQADDDKNRSQPQEIAKNQKSRTDVTGGKSQHSPKQEQQKPSRNEKLGIAGGGREKGGGSGGGGVVKNRGQLENDWEDDPIEVEKNKKPTKATTAESVPLQPEGDSKGHNRSKTPAGNRSSGASGNSSERKPPVGRNADKKPSRHPGTRGADTRHDSSHSKRPERALYVAPKRAGKQQLDERHEVVQDRQHKENRKGRDRREKNYHDHDDRDVQESDDMVTREVAVSPNKKDLTITVKTDSSKELKQREESGKGSKRYSSHRSRQRFNSESSTGSETLPTDAALATETAICDDDIRGVDNELNNLHIDRGMKETKSLHGFVSSADSDRERSTKESGRPSRPRYDDDDDDESETSAVPSEMVFSRTESGRSHDHPRSDSRKSKQQSVKFSKDVRDRKHLDDNDGSDSESNARPRVKDAKSRSGHQEVENRRRQRDRKQEDDSSEHRRRQRDRKQEDDSSEHRRRQRDRKQEDDSSEHRRRQRDRKQEDDSSEHRRRQRDRKQEDDSSEHHAKGGGLLRLPGSMQVKSEPRAIPARSDVPNDHHTSYSPYYDKHYPQVQGHSPSSSDDRHRPDSRSRGPDKSRLWDPSKPQKRPALPDKHAEKDELHFYDPEEEQSHTDTASPSDPRNPYPCHFHPGYGPYYHGYQPVPQSYFPQGYYQHPTPSPNTSWAEQVDSASHGIPITPPPGAYPTSSYGHFPPLSAAVATSDPYQMAPQEIQGSTHQSVHQQSAMRLLREAVGMEGELTNLLSRGLRGNDECIDRAISIQHDLEKVCEKMLLLDLDICNKYNVEQLLWKSAYYQLIEALRKQQDPIGVFKEYLMNLLEHGSKFYKGILSKLESGYKFSLENYSGMDPLRDEKRRSVKLALLSAQRCMIALGDIARYKELANDTSNYGQARSWYLKAQQLVPRNGRPYNQLAILALYTRRKLDAVYYYMRSLAASNQFLTARESLMSLFEEVRKKSQHKEQEELRIRREKEQAKAIARRNKARKFMRHGEDNEDQWRQEVWVSHDGVRSDANGGVQEDEDEEEEEEAKLKKMSPVEVNKKFVLSFLNAHGKLFTNIGMEAFPHVVDKLLREFSVLLKHSPPPINSTRLLQLMAINMYAAHHTQRQEPEAENMRSLQQEQAVQLGLDMFGLLVARCTTLLKDHIAHNPKETHMLHEDLHEFLPGIKVYADWMMCHMALWNPPPNCTEMTYRAAVDVWKVLASFFNIADKINTAVVSFNQFIQQQPEDCIEIRLPEDLALSGFVPLMTLPLQPVYVPAGTDKIVAMDCTRINSLRLYAEFLCGLEMPLLAYKKSKGGFFSVATEYIHADPEDDAVEELEDDDDVIIEDYTEEDEGESTEADRDINRLRERKEDLERKLKQQQRKKAQIEAIVESHRHQRKMEIEIRPIYLVPDTNCFIDHLMTIQMLVSCKRYTLVVPIVVINELDGLAKGSREGQYSDPIHAYQVQSGAAAAMQYLEDQFERGNKHVRALTGKGTVMDTIIFRSEESGNKGNNDDLILKCCLHYCEDKARDFMPHDKDSPIHLLREVVLLTNDRNLRVKALNQNVPVRDVVSFIKWAKI